MTSPDSPPVGISIEVSPGRDEEMTNTSTSEFFTTTKWIEKPMVKKTANQITIKLYKSK